MNTRKQAPLWLVILGVVVWLALQWAAPAEPEPAPQSPTATAAPVTAAPATVAPAKAAPARTASAKATRRRRTPPPSAAPAPPPAPARAGLVPGGPAVQQVDGVVVRAYGRVVHRGKVDLRPTIRRILAGERHAHRNDGSVFRNRERRLPRRPRGAYREYVHPTPGIRGAGPQRLVVDRDGPWYYTPDHYETFKSLQP